MTPHNSLPSHFGVRPSSRPGIQLSARPRGAMVFVRPASEQLFFVYTGILRGMMGVNSLEFFGRTRLLERNVVIFQDPYRAFYQRGISSRISSFDALLQYQREVRESLPHVRRVYCLGTSLGGYAALLAGHLLGVEHVWAFGPMTLLPDVFPLRGITVAPERRDLKIGLSMDNGKTTFAVYYNQRYEQDKIAALRVADKPRVVLWPQPGEGHNVVETLMTLGKLEAVLPPVS